MILVNRYKDTKHVEGNDELQWYGRNIESTDQTYVGMAAANSLLSKQKYKKWDRNDSRNKNDSHKTHNAGHKTINLPAPLNNNTTWLPKIDEAGFLSPSGNPPTRPKVLKQGNRNQNGRR